MKKLLLFMILFALTITLFAQTNTWTGSGADNNWSNVANWSLNAVPTAANDVVVPTGFTVNLNVAGTTKSIAVQGNSTFNMSNTLSILNASSISANGTVVWSNGSLTGGGTLTNSGTFNLPTTNNKFIEGLTTLNNAGTFNISDIGDLYINDGIFNNQSGGILDLQVEEGNILHNTAASRVLNNSGIIKRTNSSGNVQIQTFLNNNPGGIISVESGNLILNSLDKNLTGGVYNVVAGSLLQWNSNTILEGTLTGALEGELAWTNTVTVPASTIATFDFTGSNGVSWSNGELTGGGTLVNNSLIFLPTANNKFINGMTILSNEGTFNITDVGDLYINDGIFNNEMGGVLDLQFDEGNILHNTSTSRVLNNSGIIKRTNSTGNVQIQTILNNNTGGIISVESGNLILNSLDKNLTNGTYNVVDGSFLQWNSNTVLAGTLTGELNGEIAWTGTVTVPNASSATFDFTGSDGVSWSNGELTGGGTLVNNGLIYLPTTNNKFINGLTTLSNQGTFNITDIGDLYINDGIFNNESGGVLDLQVEEGNILHNTATSRVLNNSGIIKRTNSTGNVQIQTFLNNNTGGIISVESGNLILNSLDKNLTGGIYNVVAGSLLQWNSNTILAGTLTGLLEGEIAWTNTVTVPTSTIAAFDFTGSNGVSWSNGELTGGGTLVNNSLIFLPTANNKFINGMTTLSNEGTFNITDIGDLYINNGIFDNETGGILDLQFEEGNILHNTADSRILNNSGIIKRTTSTGNVQIQTVLNNDGGVISVESGNLIFNSLDKNLTNGIYNVVDESFLQWDGNTVLAGTLTGDLDGEIAWTGTVTVPDTTSATFDFTGDSGVSWSNGNLTGGGTLINRSLIFLPTTNNKFINGLTTLSNEGIFNISDIGDLYINDGIFNNEIGGVLDLQTDEGNILHNTASSRVLNNFGLLTKSAGAGTTQVQTFINNSGTIDAMIGVLNFGGSLGFTNTVDGIVKGIASITLPTPPNFTNNGTFAPGGSPGILNVNGTFKSSTTSILDVELNGLTSGTQFDVLAITGTDAIFDGSVNVTMNFAANLNDEFIVATTTGTISQCNLAPTASADFNGMTYTFDVFCRNNNQVVLGVNDIALGVNDFQLSESSIQIYPNPVRNMLTIKNKNNLELENAQITDITGKIITTFNLKNMGLTKEISLENLSSGMYFLKINGLNSSITKRVIKQ